MDTKELLNNSLERNNAEGYDYNVFSEKEKDGLIEIQLNEINNFSDSNCEEQPYDIDQKEVEQLVASIKSIGLIHPIVVIKDKNKNYSIISGHKRKKAFEEIGLKKIPAIVKDLDENQAYMEMAEANIQRNKSKPSELGKIINRYVEFQKSLGEKCSISSVCDKFAITKKSYYRYSNIAKMIIDIQSLYDDGYLANQTIDYFVNFTPNQQNTLFEYVFDNNLSINVAKAKLIANLAEKIPDFTHEDLENCLFPPSEDEDNEADVDLSTSASIYDKLKELNFEKFSQLSLNQIDDFILIAVSEKLADEEKTDSAPF